jgi:ferritin
MLSLKLESMLNEQIAHELTNSKKYRVVSAWFAKEGYEGLASYFDEWSKEEDGHARWVQSYLIERSACVDIPATEEVFMDFKDALSVAKYVMDTEVDTSDRLYKIMEYAKTENCYMTQDFVLSVMIHEQTEEEAKAQTLLDLTTKAKDSCGLLVVDGKYA